MFKELLQTQTMKELQKEMPNRMSELSNSEFLSIYETELHFITSNNKIKSEIQMNLDKWRTRLQIALAEQGFVEVDEDLQEETR